MESPVMRTAECVSLSQPTPSPSFPLRPYQVEAIEAIEKAEVEGIRRPRWDPSQVSHLRGELELLAVAFEARFNPQGLEPDIVCREPRRVIEMVDA